MKRDLLTTGLILVIAGAVASWLFTSTDRPDPHADAGHAAHDHEEHIHRGRHGGRLLQDDDFALEVTVFEAGIPPEFHVYAYQRGAPIPPEQIDLSIELERLGGAVERFSFTPQGDYLRGNGVVAEPHSFDVTVAAEFGERSYQWRYASHEGRTQIPAAIARDAGIETATAGPVIIYENLSLTGRVQADPDRLSQVRPRFAGVVQSVRAKLGDSVQAGDVLASVQSNESLQTYSITAPIAGVVIKRDAQIGEATGNEALFIIADVSSVWVELDLFSRDIGRVQLGQTVTVETLDGQYSAPGVIEWISPVAAHASQSVAARVTMDNSQNQLRLGQFVRGVVAVAGHKVAVAVKRSALQRFRDHQVVFARVGDTYEARMLELGRGNSDWLEVLGGLEPGIDYVTANSYLIKADIEKSGAAHDH